MKLVLGLGLSGCWEQESWRCWEWVRAAGNGVDPSVLESRIVAWCQCPGTHLATPPWLT